MRVVLCSILSFALGITVGVARSDDVPKEKYVAATIPLGLMEGANAVVRYEKLHFKVKNTRSASFTYKRIVTVLNARARYEGEIELGYDKFRSLEDFDMTLYDAQGNELRSLKNKEIKDYSATSGYSLYDDNRMKHARLYHETYPYTVEIEYEYDYDGFISWPSWYPEEAGAAIEQTMFQVDVPSSAKLRYWKTVTEEPTITPQGGMTSYLWHKEMLAPFVSEPVGPSAADQQQHVLIAPAEFELEKHRGDFSTWKSFGAWFFDLYMERQLLPEKARQEVRTLTAGVSDAKEKARILYRHLQTTTRYVSIQLGIGGWQPFDARYVCERGYGDCKALSNYMGALLKEADIRSYPALIDNGPSSQRVVKEFSHNAFNHVILFVPLPKDTIWLECTSQTIPFGHIGTYNENRYALVVGQNGGELVRTMTSKANENLQQRKATVHLAAGGNATAQIQTFYSGNQQDYVRYGLNDATPQEKEEWLKEHLDIPVFNIRSAEFRMGAREQSSAGVSLDLELPRYATVAGSRLLFQPNLMEKRTYVPPVLEKRKYPIVTLYPYIDVDSITYELPEGYSVEALPKPVKFETAFAKFQSGVSQTNAITLLYTRRLEVTIAELPPEKYQEYRTFFSDVALADKTNAAIVKK